MKFTHGHAALAAFVVVGMMLWGSRAGAVLLNVGVPGSGFWPATWTPVTGFGDEPGGTFNWDLVGTITSPRYLLYSAVTTDYVYFRTRLDNSSIADFSGGVVQVLIDYTSPSSGGNIPDYAFAWDARTTTVLNDAHGLEMMVFGSNPDGRWSTTTMLDLDGNTSGRGTNDINGNSRTTDGYVRYSASGDGNSDTLVDIAVRWEYLTNNTNLRYNQQWRLAVATRRDTNDHAAFDYDVGGLVGGVAGVNSLTQDTAWSNTILVPEPSSLVLALPLAGMLLAARRRRSA